MPITLTRSLLVIVVPGGLATVTWILWAFIVFDFKDDFYTKFGFLVNVTMFGFVVIVGTVLEGISTMVEVRWDREREDEFEVSNNWYRYLSLTTSTEPVGFRYIGRLVTAMYFELSMMWAAVLFGLGLSLVLCTKKPDNFTWFSLVTIVGAIAASLYFRWQAHGTHQVLCETRREMNKRMPTTGRTRRRRVKSSK